MSILALQELAEQFMSSQTMADWLQLYAAQTWTKIGFAWGHPPLRLHETTITQNLVYDCWLADRMSPWGVKLFEAVDEAANGNDLEIAVETGRGYVLLPAQAKMLFKDGRYPAISHTVGERYQADLLLAYARKVKGWPMFILYNHDDDDDLASRIEKEWHMPVESFGISLCDAVYVKDKFGPVGKSRWKIPRFGDLHPAHAWPLHYLGFDMHRWFPPLQGQHAIKYYTRDELKEDDAFKDLNPPPAIGKIPLGMDELLRDTLRQKQTKKAIEFNPKFRIMFSMQKEKTRLWVMS